jgi:hypothetical protein
LRQEFKDVAADAIYAIDEGKDIRKILPKEVPIDK